MTLADSGRALLACALAWPLALAAAADENPDQSMAQEDRIAALERKLEVLTSELERTRADMALPEETELTSAYGLGPAASKVYSVTRGLSIGGYTEGFYQAIVDDKTASGQKNRADLLRAVLYAGYKFTDNIVYNMEIEFEHASTSSTSTSSGGSVSVEFAALDYLMNDYLNGRVGLVLAPMGFINEIHEPPFYYGTQRPAAERRIIPSTWRENGIGIFGQLAEELSYKIYGMNGFNAAGFGPSGLRGGRQKGNRALAEDLAFVGRLDYTPLPGLLLGGSVYVGNSGQNQELETAADPNLSVDVPDALTTIWELHAQYQKAGLHTRALFTMADIGDASELSTALNVAGELDDGEAVAESMLGLYGEIGYEILQWLYPETQATLEPFYRYEYVDTQFDVPSGFDRDRTQAQNIHTVGLHFKPIPNVVLKLDYRNRSALEGAFGDEINAGFGLVF